MTRARNLGRLANQNTLSADNTNNFVGIGSTQPDAKLDVNGTVLVGTAITIGGASGIVSATAFYGDGSNLDGVASAGLGTALAEEGAGSVIYYTDAVLGIGSTVIVSVPSTTSDVAYTQYATVSVDGDADLIVAEDDDFVADILGIGSDVQTPGTLTNNSRVRAARLVNSAGTGAPQLQFGAEVPVGYGITGAGGINITGVATAASFDGNATGLTGTPDITVNNITGVAATFSGVLTYEDVTNIDSLGIVTARSGVRVLAGNSLLLQNVAGSAEGSIECDGAGTNTDIRIRTNSTERLRVSHAGLVGIGTNSPGGTLHVENSGELNAFFEGSASTLGARILLKNNDNTANAYNDIEGVDAGGQGTSAIRFINVNDGNNEGALAIRTRPSGGSITERVRITSTGGVHFNNAELIERVNIVANKLSAVPNVNLDNGMVHYYTTNETTTATPNIISTAGINTNMATGDTMSITIMSKPNNAGYFPKISIDGVATGITTYWNGGSAPSSAESSGVDANTYQIIKTADATYDVLANTSNFA